MATALPGNEDIEQFMGLIVNGTYSNKDLFLRELICNASEALRRLRDESAVDQEAEPARGEAARGRKRKTGPEPPQEPDLCDWPAVHRLATIDGKKLKSAVAAVAGLGSQAVERDIVELKADFEPLVKLMREVLGDRVEQLLGSASAPGTHGGHSAERADAESTDIFLRGLISSASHALGRVRHESGVDQDPEFLGGEIRRGTKRKGGLEDFCVVNPNEPLTVQQWREVHRKKLKSLAEEGLAAVKENERRSIEELIIDFEPLTKLMKEVLGEKVDRVIVSSRMADSPCVLTASEDGWSANMERIMKAQALQDGMTSYMVSKKTMEVNPHHPIIAALRRKVVLDRCDSTVRDMVELLFDTSLLTSGVNPDEPILFAGRIHRMIKLGLSIDDGMDDDDDLPSLEEFEGAAEEAWRMEQVD